MGRFKIGTRIYAGFFIVLALLGAVAGASYLGLASGRSGANEFIRLSGRTQSFLQVEQDVVELDRNLIAYMRQTTAENLAQVQESQAKLEANIQSALDSSQSAERRRIVEMMVTFAGQYASTFDQVVAARTARDQIVREEMDVVGAEAEAALTELVAGAIAEGNLNVADAAQRTLHALMAARLSANKFLANTDPALAEQLAADSNAALSSFTEAVAELDRRAYRPADKEKVLVVADLGGRYADAFGRVVEATLTYEKLAGGTLQKIAANLQGLAYGVSDSLVDEAEREGAMLDTTIESTIGTASAISAVAFAAGLLIAWVIARGIVNPVSGMTATMTRLAAGDKSVAVPALKNRDEIGAMAKAVQIFKDNALEMERLQAEQEAAKAKAEEERRAAMLALADNFERSVGGIVGTVASAATEMQTAAQTLSATAEESSRQATAVAATAEQTSSNVQTVASAAEQLSASTQEIGRQVEQSTGITRDAVGEAERTAQTVNDLARAAQKIGEVVSLISDIAAQTNLLALNATIEAARAGEAGKGFAVVASEVKNLATQTAKATDEISAQIAAMQGATTETVGAIDGIGRTIARMSEIAATIAAAVEEQNAATHEISNNVSQAARGTTEVSSTIVGVTQAAGEVGSAATQMLGSAGQLAQESERLRSEVAEFLRTVRAA